MKKYSLLFLGIFFSYLLKGQDVKFDIISQSTTSVSNRNNFSTKIIIKNEMSTIFDKILYPGETKSFNLSYDKSTVNNLFYTAIYDDESFKRDMNSVEAAKKARDQRREQEGWFKGLLALGDQVFLGGAGAKILEVGKYGSMLINGASEEEWAEAIEGSAVGYGIEKGFDGRVERGLASGAYELAKSMQPKEYKDLQEWLVYFMNKRKSGYKNTGKIIDTAKLPSKINVPFPRLSISGGYLLNQKLGIDPLSEGEDTRSISQTIGEDIPFEIRINYQWKETMGMFFEYGRSSSISNTRTDFDYINEGDAINFTSYSFGISPSYSYLEFGLGASYLQENVIRNELNGTTNIISSANRVSGFIEPRINIKLGKLFNVFGSWKGNIFIHPDYDNTIIMYHFFKTGIAINFSGNEFDFSN